MKICLSVLMGFFLFAASPAMAEEPLTGTAALICKASQHGQLFTKTLVLDYTQKLVNGMPATFADAMIVWIENHNSKVEHHELNRIRGTYNTWVEHETPGEPLPTYTCEKAKVKF